MINQAEITSIVETYLQTLGDSYYIVEVAVHPGNRIIVELGADHGMSIDECVALNKHIESQLDREQEDFELEVGSAGLSSAFKVLRQYQGAIDSEVEILRKGGIKEKGILTNIDSNNVVSLRVERKQKQEGAKRKVTIEETIQIPFEEILQTKRVIKF